VVDDFGIKYVGKQHAQHLSTSLRENYKITEDWTGELYLGIKLNWDTTKIALSICLCRITCPKLSTNFSIQRHIAPSMHLTPGQKPPTTNDSNP